MKLLELLLRVMAHFNIVATLALIAWVASWPGGFR